MVHEFPYIEAEVRYAIKEYALTAVDVLARRTSLAFLNVEAAEDALPRVVEIMGEELQWNKQEKKVWLVGLGMVKCPKTTIVLVVKCMEDLFHEGLFADDTFTWHGFCMFSPANLVNMMLAASFLGLHTVFPENFRNNFIFGRTSRSEDIIIED